MANEYYAKCQIVGSADWEKLSSGEQEMWTRAYQLYNVQRERAIEAAECVNKWQNFASNMRRSMRQAELLRLIGQGYEPEPKILRQVGIVPKPETKAPSTRRTQRRVKIATEQNTIQVIPKVGTKTTPKIKGRDE